MQHFRPTIGTVHWGYFDASLEPIGEVRSGEAFLVSSASGFPDDAVPPEWRIPEITDIFRGVTQRGPGPHILTGPIRVAGARIGAVLQIDIQHIELTAPYGYSGLRPRKGLFPELVHAPSREIIALDRHARSATLSSGVTLALAPFFGILGVAPPLAWGRIDSSPPREHGGNLDLKDLTIGSTLFLPVWNDGALFSAGDGHAVQGNGEVTINALETSLRGQFCVTIRDDFSLELPLAVTPAHLITLGFDEDLDVAARQAVQVLIRLLQRYYGLPWEVAYRLVSLAADLHITQVVNGNKGVHVSIARSLLEQLGRRAPFLP